MAYSLDFRKRVMRIKGEKDLTFVAASERFGVGIRTLFNWSNRMEPKTTRDKPATKIDMGKLRGDIREYPDAFQHERAKRFDVSASAIFYALRRLGITYKKNPESPQG